MNRGIELLQSFALPLGYGAVFSFRTKGRGILRPFVLSFGAEDEIRTRDVHLGKVTLYH